LKLSLKSRLILSTSLMSLIAILTFSLTQIRLSTLAAERLLDQQLERRLKPPGDRRFMPPPREDGGPPDRPRRNPPSDDFRRPRLFRLDGSNADPRNIGAPLSIALLRKSVVNQTIFETITLNGTQLRIASIKVNDPHGESFIVQVAQETDSLDIAKSGQWVALVSALPIIGLFSWLLGIFLSRAVLNPVKKLTLTAEKIAQNPLERERMGTQTNDEIGRLATAFDQMTDRLQDANERQRRFTGDAAHELRTPLTAISLATENGLHEKSTHQEMRDSLETAQRSVKSMEKMTSMLLALSRLDNSNKAMPTGPTDLHPLIDTALRQLGLNNEKRIIVKLDNLLVTANTDATLQIITNLIENAVAYTPPDGQILIEAIEGILMVKDSGGGISAEHLPRLFDRFYRVDSSRTRSAGGNGLGLAICKSLAEAMGATMSAESKVGVGSTFFLEFSKKVENS
jgi:signal transduction histidine kinase